MGESKLNTMYFKGNRVNAPLSQKKNPPRPYNIMGQWKQKVL